jgi:hypothetical protein
MPVTGTVHLLPFADFAHVPLGSARRDKLIEGNASVAVELTGADLRFYGKRGARIFGPRCQAVRSAIHICPWANAKANRIRSP